MAAPTWTLSVANTIFTVRITGMVLVSTTSMARIFYEAKFNLRTALCSLGGARMWSFSGMIHVWDFPKDMKPTF